jgi:hypothetical protein
MGTKISIDKHVSNLDDILDMPPTYFDKIKFESKISPSITQHLKVRNIFLFSLNEIYLLLHWGYRFGNSVKRKGNLTV